VDTGFSQMAMRQKKESIARKSGYRFFANYEAMAKN